jgi:hypothetical protein
LGLRSAYALRSSGETWRPRWSHQIRDVLLPHAPTSLDSNWRGHSQPPPSTCVLASVGIAFLVSMLDRRIQRHRTGPSLADVGTNLAGALDPSGRPAFGRAPVSGSPSRRNERFRPLPKARCHSRRIDWSRERPHRSMQRDTDEVLWHASALSCQTGAVVGACGGRTSSSPA